MLVSPFPDPNNGWDHGDKEFWEPLIDISMTTDNTRSFGQCISDIFPNVRYVAAVCAPPAKLRSDTNKTASIYVSDRHIIRKSDTAAMRKMIFDTVGEIRQGRNVPRTFADFEQGPEFEADRMNMPDFDGTYYALQEALKQPGRVTLPEERTMIEFEPFRNVATIILDDMLLKLHVMSTVKPQAMVGKMRGKVIDIFSVLRRVVAMEGDEVRVKRLKLALHAEADPARPADVPYFQIVREWMNDVSAVQIHLCQPYSRFAYRQLSSHPPLVNKNNLPESLFDLSVASAHRSTLPEFKKKCVQFHEALSAIHSASPTGANTALPTCILFHGFDIARPDEASCFFARMDFSTPELATAVFFGRMHADEEGYRVSSCYQHGQKVQDREALERLNELMIRAGSE
jgi:hypothetical protein